MFGPICRYSFALMLIFVLKMNAIAADSSTSVSFNGKFVRQAVSNGAKANSPNGIYWCDYAVGRVGDEVRELTGFRFFKNDQMLFEMDLAPGSDLYISNSGICAFMDMKHHYRGELTIHFFSEEGEILSSKTFSGAHDFQFSPNGNRFGVSTSKGLHVITIPSQETHVYPGGYQFDFSENGELVAIASEGSIRLYSNGALLRGIKTDFLYTREVRISSEHDLIVAIDKRNLAAYSLEDGELLFTDTLKGARSFRDLFLEDGKVLAGVHNRSNGDSRGILRTYSRYGELVSESEERSRTFRTFEAPAPPKGPADDGDPIPWPFVPFDEMHTVWNYYEQHMGGDEDWSYLHQGLDMIVPIAEPTYTVAPGIVKCVLTLGGAVYWRIAISPQQDPGWSDGWLYAHLIENTIQFDVGDTVQLHDYLGDIIEWTPDWGHIHFVEIADSGLVWSYDDNEWGINFNPLTVLEPDTDLFPPVIEDVFIDSKFGLCENETSNYLDPDSLYGEIDIITKVVDYVGDSEWQQPAFSSFYWVERLPEGDVVFPRTLGHVLNHKYPFYSSGNYEPYATVLYKRDAILLPSSWMSMERNFYHILTNNNGDSLVDLSEKDLAFHTDEYPDGEYRIFIEVYDEFGNASVDSMDVWFVQGISGIDEEPHRIPLAFHVSQNYPNPFNPSTTIAFDLPGTVDERRFVSLTVYDIRGRRVRTLIDSELEPGSHKIHWDGQNDRGQSVASGIYLYTLRAGEERFTRKMMVLK